MPNLREHHKRDIELFGERIAKKYKFVHSLMDSAQPYLEKHHRKYFHDAKTLMWIGWYYGPIAFMVATEHLRQDRERTNLNLNRRRKKIKK